MSEGAFEVVMFYFVEAIHVELSHETVDFVMSEVSWQDNFFKFDHIFDHELETTGCPVNYLVVLFILNKRGFTETISKALKTNPATSLSYCCLVWLS